MLRAGHGGRLHSSTLLRSHSDEGDPSRVRVKGGVRGHAYM